MSERAAAHPSASRILSRFSFYCESPPGVKDEMLECAALAGIPTGTQTLVIGGDRAQVPLIDDGVLRVYRIGAGGREITLYRARGGETCLITVLSVLTGQSFEASASVEEELSVLLIPGLEFRRWVASYERVRAFVFETMAVRLTRMFDLLEEVRFRRMDGRLAAHLLERVSAHASPGSAIPLTQEALASDLGSCREVVGRLLRDFEQKGLLTLARGRIGLLDLAELQRVADQR